MTFKFWLPIIWTLYLREQRCEDPWLFFEDKRGHERLGNIDVEVLVSYGFISSML